MRIRKIRKLIQTMKSIPPDQYEQEVWFDPCGTRACLAGHTLLMEGYDGKAIDRCETPDLRAGKILGLSRTTAHRLFNGFCEGWRLESDTWACDTKTKQVACAVRELENLITLGPYEKDSKRTAARNATRAWLRSVRLEMGRKRRAHLRPSQHAVNRLRLRIGAR